MSTETYYDILDIYEDATPEEIKKAYRRQAQVWHPDKTPGELAKARFIKIKEAYETLSDQKKREDYDRGRFEDYFKKPDGEEEDLTSKTWNDDHRMSEIFSAANTMFSMGRDAAAVKRMLLRQGLTKSEAALILSWVIEFRRDHGMVGREPDYASYRLPESLRQLLKRKGWKAGLLSYIGSRIPREKIKEFFEDALMAILIFGSSTVLFIASLYVLFFIVIPYALIPALIFLLHMLFG